MEHDDFGRERVPGDPADRYRFRTPTLRNVALTAPYGHSGCYNSLRAIEVRDSLNAVLSPSPSSFTEEQAASAIALIRRIADTGGPPC